MSDSVLLSGSKNNASVRQWTVVERVAEGYRDKAGEYLGCITHTLIDSSMSDKGIEYLSLFLGLTRGGYWLPERLPTKR